jgi:hypothetical protein
MAENKEEKATGKKEGKPETQLAPFMPAVDIKDEDFLLLHQSFITGNYVHGADQLVKEIDRDTLVIGFFDPFARKYWKPARFSVVMTKDAALALAKKILEIEKSKK